MLLFFKLYFITIIRHQIFFPYSKSVLQLKTNPKIFLDACCWHNCMAFEAILSHLDVSGEIISVEITLTRPSLFDQLVSL